MNYSYIPDFHIYYNWFDISYDLDYTIGERFVIMSSLAGPDKAGMMKVGVI